MAHFHFIGIGGTGLSAIARVLFERGETVTGSDLALSPAAQELIGLGISVKIGHDSQNIIGVDKVIRSSAISDTNPEVTAAVKAGIPVLKRREFLRELTGKQKVIAVAGTHGKTTTTAMIAWCLSEIGFDPSYVIGSTSKNLGKNANAGKGDFFIIEADEYDNMFLGLTPDVLVLTNIEHDHPDCFPTEADYLNAFLKLTDNLSPDGNIIAFYDNEGVQSTLSSIDSDKHLIKYGTSTECDLQITDIKHSSTGGVSFEVNNVSKIVCPIQVSLSLPGDHNAYNATAALAVAEIIGADMQKVKNALALFNGTERRFDILGVVNGITIIDDYAHHPTEIRATLSAARSRYPSANIWAVWQPHTYSRTQELFNDFISSFDDCDHVLITEIYRSRENRRNYSSQSLVEKMRHADKYYMPSLEITTDFLKSHLTSGDVLLVLSAGDANQITANLLKYLLNNEGKND